MWLLVSCGVDGCNCLCKGGGPEGWVVAHCTAGEEAGVTPASPAGLLSQALREEKTGWSQRLLGNVILILYLKKTNP